jgi:predicted nucleotidyltransferase
MNFGLSESSLDHVKTVLARHPVVQEAIVFGSRALGREQPQSDVDIALRGDISSLEIEKIVLELDELPLPYVFDVQAYDKISNVPLIRHIDRVGKVLYTREGSVEHR